jgi:hypothetical protein
MRPFPRRLPRTFGRRLARPAFVVLLLAAFLAASQGVMPSAATVARWLRPAGARGIERFACENCGCGCASAHECWTACCCHTPVERLAWALRNGVLPPADVRFADADWIAAANCVKPGSATCGACVVRLKARLASGVALVGPGGAEAPAGACCATARACAPSDECRDGGSCRSGAARGPVLGALGCKGQSPMVLVAPILAAADPISFVLARSGVPCPLGVVPDRDLAWRSLTLPVLVPPPRVA